MAYQILKSCGNKKIYILIKQRLIDSFDANVEYAVSESIVKYRDLLGVNDLPSDVKGAEKDLEYFTKPCKDHANLSKDVSMDGSKKIF